MTSIRSNFLAGIIALMFITTLVGCGSAEVTPTYRTAHYVYRPDMLVVYNFAVTPQEVSLDQGVAASALRDAQNRAQSQEEIQIGRAVSEMLARSLVDELRKVGVTAFRAHEIRGTSNTTIHLTGRFVSVDGGNQTLRTWVGFGMGRSELRTQFQFHQGRTFLGEAESVADSGLKPGMLTSLGVGAAAGSVGTAAAVGAGGTGISEALLAGVEADAQRTAAKIADQIAERYRWRGWIAAR